MFSFAGFLLACGSIALSHGGWFCSDDCSGGPRRQRVGHDADAWDQALGSSNAVLVAILARITHVSVELFAGGCLYLLGKRRTSK